jgi:hypothetical protein
LTRTGAYATFALLRARKRFSFERLAGCNLLAVPLFRPTAFQKLGGDAESNHPAIVAAAAAGVNRPLTLTP